MGFPNHALLSAPVARRLDVEFPSRYVFKLQGATNGVLQGWHTIDEDSWTANPDAEITIYKTLRAVPLAFRRRLVYLRVYPDSTRANDADDVRFWAPKAYKLLNDCGAGDFVRTDVGVKTGATLAVADRPAEYLPLHVVYGYEDAFGGP